MQSGRNALLTTFSSDLRFASQSHPQILRRRNVGLFSGYPRGKSLTLLQRSGGGKWGFLKRGKEHAGRLEMIMK